MRGLTRRPRARDLGASALLAVLALLVPSAGGAAAPRPSLREAVAAGEEPTPGALYKDGPSGRYLLGGTWLLRADGGDAHGFASSTSLSGWRPVSVPNAWNAGSHTTASYEPQVYWYRKDFALPSSAAGDGWVVRFESVNNDLTAWLNGHEIGRHDGAFLPFELVLPASDLQRDGVNRLVLRVSDAHSFTDLPAVSATGPSGVVGGWWNYGGLLREVYLRRIGAVDFQSVQVLPHLACATCAATVSYVVVLRSDAARAQRVRVVSDFGSSALDLGTRTLAPGATATYSGQLTVTHPQLWSPASPHLYDVTLAAQGATDAAPALADYTLESGIRSVTVSGGQLELNYQPVHLRGAGLVEDSPADGSALSIAQQAALIENAKRLGATIIRSQYPLSGYEEQLADELGIMLWSEIPAYQVRDQELTATTPRAVATLRQNILANGNHPSIVIWSIGNELDPLVGPEQTAYIAALVHAAHALDPTRPVGLAYQGYPSVGCQAGYAPLQVLGINDYFGWYPGPSGEIADPSLLPQYLATERACYPKQALMVSEFGAEANRDGPVDERGTYEFQSQFVGDQLAAFAATPWLSGAIYWALQDFAVRPGWTGGNPYPDPPIFHKGLLSLAGQPKPAWSVVQAAYSSLNQLG